MQTIARLSQRVHTHRMRNLKRGKQYLRWSNHYLNSARTGLRNILNRMKYAKSLRHRTSNHSRHVFNVYFSKLRAREVYYRNWINTVNSNVRRLRAEQRRQVLLRIATAKAQAGVVADTRRIHYVNKYVKRVEHFERNELYRVKKMGKYVTKLNKNFSKLRKRYHVTSRLYTNASDEVRRLLRNVVHRLRSKYVTTKQQRTHYLKRQLQYSSSYNKIIYTLIGSIRKQLVFYKGKILNVRHRLLHAKDAHHRSLARSLLKTYVKRFANFRFKYRLWNKKAAHSANYRMKWAKHNARTNATHYMKLQMKAHLYTRLHKSAISSTLRNIYGMILRKVNRRVASLKRLVKSYKHTARVFKNRAAGFVKLAYTFNLRSLKLVKVAKTYHK